MRKYVKFTYVNEVEAMYERLRVKVEVERVSTFTYKYVVSILFTHVKFTCVRTEKLRDGGNPPWAIPCNVLTEVKFPF